MKLSRYSELSDIHSSILEELEEVCLVEDLDMVGISNRKALC